MCQIWRTTIEVLKPFCDCKKHVSKIPFASLNFEWKMSFKGKEGNSWLSIDWRWNFKTKRLNVTQYWTSSIDRFKNENVLAKHFMLNIFVSFKGTLHKNQRFYVAQMLMQNLRFQSTSVCYTQIFEILRYECHTQK